MVAEVGHFALILALMFAFAGASLPHIGIAKRRMSLIKLADQSAYMQAVLAVISFGCLMSAYILSDFSLVNVATNSHTDKPLLYKIAGTWGNHEGSLLMWVLLLCLFNASIAFFGRNLPAPFRARVIAVQSLIAIGFMLFIIITSNPFERMIPAAIEGRGLNPLLQDPGLAIHPPMLYLGYVGLSVAFSFAIAALLDGDVSPMWARWVRPWTLAAWMFLTAGLALGSWWAYYELGWGGWWFWDPTENAAFMPWIAATALLHSAIVLEKRDALKSWTVLLAIVAFSFSLLGTFLVRSGVVNSVHSFASDPERGIFILLFLAIVVGASLTLYAWRAPKLSAGGLFGLVSRESALVVNNILLSTYAAVVLIGTLYPLILEAWNGSQITVGPPFFNFASAVVMSPLFVALGFGPLLAWKRGKISRAAQITIPALIVALVVIIATLWSNIGAPVMTLIGLGFGAWLVVSALAELRFRTQNFKFKRIKALPLASWGMVCAHAGVGVLLLGMTISESWPDEKIVAMQSGETIELGGFDVTFNGAEPIAGPNYTAVRGHFTVKKEGRMITTLAPEDRLYADPVMNTTEAAIHPLFSGDLYAVIGQSTGEGRFAMRLYFKPYVSLLWLGMVMLVFAGLLSLFDRRHRIGAPSGKKGA